MSLSAARPLTEVLQPLMRSWKAQLRIRPTHGQAPLIPLSRQRTFIASSQDPPAPTRLTAHRLLPYPALSIYDIVADISSYPEFLPYCRSARVTSQSAPDEHYARRWPNTATLTIGFQDRISESFTSRVFCVPPMPRKGRAGLGFVEAVSGSEIGEPVFDVDETEHLNHHLVEDVRGSNSVKVEEENAQSGNSPLAYLKTRWSVGAFPFKPGPGEGKKTQEYSLEPDVKSREMTEVNLLIEYRFRSPIYEVLGKTVTAKVAEMMIGAFESRVKSMLGTSDRLGS